MYTYINSWSIWSSSHLGDEVADVGQDPTGSKVHLPVGWLDELLVQTQVLHRTLPCHTQLIQVADTNTHTQSVQYRRRTSIASGITSAQQESLEHKD